MRQRCESFSLDVRWRREFLTERFDGMMVPMRLIWLDLAFHTGRRNERRKIQRMNFLDNVSGHVKHCIDLLLFCLLKLWRLPVPYYQLLAS